MRPLWIPEPVRRVLGVVACQVHFLSPRGQFSVSVVYLYVFKCQRTPLTRVRFSYCRVTYSSIPREEPHPQDIRRRAIPDAHRSFEGFIPQFLRNVRSS